MRSILYIVPLFDLTSSLYNPRACVSACLLPKTFSAPILINKHHINMMARSFDDLMTFSPTYTYIHPHPPIPIIFVWVEVFFISAPQTYIVIVQVWPFSNIFSRAELYFSLMCDNFE